MKRIAITLLLVLILTSFHSSGQETSTRRVVYAELLGSGVFGSVNYDFRFKPGNNGPGLRIGGGYVPDVIIIPVGLNGSSG